LITHFYFACQSRQSKKYQQDWLLIIYIELIYHDLNEMVLYNKRQQRYNNWFKWQNSNSFIFTKI